MKIKQIKACQDWTLEILAEDGRMGKFDVSPYLDAEAFAALKDKTAFMQVSNGGYFVEWQCGADLSADTIEARWQLIEQAIAA
jgi:hypothetical protein